MKVLPWLGVILMAIAFVVLGVTLIENLLNEGNRSIIITSSSGMILALLGIGFAFRRRKPPR